jgi:hypothetical protein
VKSPDFFTPGGKTGSALWVDRGSLAHGAKKGKICFAGAK